MDPKCFPDVNDAVNEFAVEIRMSELKIGERINEGEFADIFKADLHRSGESTHVAVKMLKVTFIISLLKRVLFSNCSLLNCLQCQDFTVYYYLRFL